MVSELRGHTGGTWKWFRLAPNQTRRTSSGFDVSHSATSPHCPYGLDRLLGRWALRRAAMVSLMAVV